MKNLHVIYHWWNSLDTNIVSANHNPLILSISTLRANSDVPITVLDISESENNWEHFPEKLNFKVEKIQPFCGKFQYRIAGWKHLSRLFDIEIWSKKHSIDKVMYVDSDFFFFRNPFPLSGDLSKFCWDGWNSGFFYLDFSTTSNEEFIEVFKAHTISAIYDEEIRKVYNKFKTYEAWYGVWDEMILLLMKNRTPYLFQTIDRGEHLSLHKLPPEPSETHKGFHCNGLHCVNPVTLEGHCRKIIPLLSTEIYSQMQKVFNQQDLNCFFSPELQNYFNTKVSLYQMMAFKKSIINDDGLSNVCEIYNKIKSSYYCF